MPIIEATLLDNANGERLNLPWMALVVLALEDGLRPNRLIDPETTPADGFLRAIRRTAFSIPSHWARISKR
ncbi:hypothetical protein ACNJX9_11790 [Bradyrhizobium sp. DASA03076]|uniref:hypothetical protein n=1 Tax=Bradyrhizobium sp. BLXBL-03 TaxID=3395916 RepID=UPI003F716F1A